MIGWLEQEDAAFGGKKLAVPIAAAGGLGEGIEPAFGAVDDGKTDIDAGLDELGGDENDGAAGLAQCFRFLEDRDHVGRAHPRGEMEGGGMGLKPFEESLGGFGGVEDEEATAGSVVKKVGDQLIVIERSQVSANNAFERLKKLVLVPDDLGDFCRRDADGKVFAAVERGLGGGAEDRRRAEVVNETAQTAENRVEQRCRQGLDFVEDDHAAGRAVELPTGAGAICEERFEKADVGGDDQRRVPVFGRQAVGFRFLGGVELGVMLEDDVAAEFF